MVPRIESVRTRSAIAAAGGTAAAGAVAAAGAFAPACGGDAETQDVELTFAAAVGDEPAACGETYEGVGASETTVEISDLRFYVSNVYLVGEDGDDLPLHLDRDDDWQLEDVALLDFEDGTAACSEFGTPDENHTVVGDVEVGDYTGLRFDLGVPYGLNHLDVDNADPPMNLHALQWNWRDGYIFLKVDLLTEREPPDDRFIVHLGSTGCGAGPPLEPPDEPCANPNVARVEVDGFDPDEDVVALDLAALLADTDLDEAADGGDPFGGGAGCQSFEEDEEHCVPIFESLGLNWEDGECVDECAAQRAFSVP